MGPISGGLIGSKLDKNLDRISDCAWLKIIRDKAIPERSRGKWEQIDDNNAVTSSVRQFSDSLGKIAVRFPERFGQLALNFPEDTHPSYISAIFDAMAITKPHSDIPENEKAQWLPAHVDTVTSVWEKFRDMSDRAVAVSFCRLIRARAHEEWPDIAIQKLIDFAANHPDPEELNDYNDTSQKDSIRILNTNGTGAIKMIDKSILKIDI